MIPPEYTYTRRFWLLWGVLVLLVFGIMVPRGRSAVLTFTNGGANGVLVQYGGDYSGGSFIVAPHSQRREVCKSQGAAYISFYSINSSDQSAWAQFGPEEISIQLSDDYSSEYWTDGETVVYYVGGNFNTVGDFVHNDTGTAFYLGLAFGGVVLVFRYSLRWFKRAGTETS